MTTYHERATTYFNYHWSYIRQYNESAFSSSRTGSLKITVVTPQKNQSFLPLGDTNTLQIHPNLKNPKNHPIKKIPPKIIKSLNILKQVFYKLKHTNIRMTQMIILIPKMMSQFQVTTKMIMIKTTS